MRLSDVMKPAMEWSEAAMLPAQTRTLSGGAALSALHCTVQMKATPVSAPVPERPLPSQQQRLLRRAALNQILRP